MAAFVGDLEIDQNLEVEKKLRIIRIAGWTFFSLILLAALLGFLGNGPFSTRRIGDSSAWLELNRFDHYEADTHLTIGFDGDTAQTDSLNISIDRAYLERVAIERVVPEPLKMESTPEAINFVFALGAGRKTGVIRFDIRAFKSGTAAGRVKIGGAAPLSIDQFFFP